MTRARLRGAGHAGVMLVCVLSGTAIGAETPPTVAAELLSAGGAEAAPTIASPLWEGLQPRSQSQPLWEGLQPRSTSGKPERLLYAEPLLIEAESASPASAAGAAHSSERRLRFLAFGRAFALTLTRNPALAASTTPTADFAAESGALDGVARSWVRITRRGAELTGLLFDGAEYYAIEPVAGLLPALDPALRPPATVNAIFRLADLLLDPALLGCVTAAPDGEATSGATALALLADELDAPAIAAALAPERQIRLAPVADYEFANRFGSSAESEIAARLNVVDGIFSAQVGLHVVGGPPTVFRSNAPPYPFSDDGSGGLLGQLSDYREANHDGYGLTHLFTGKTLDGGIVGVAWQSAVCFAREGAGLSTSAGLTRTTSALVAAHEVGHNFGAPHDGEAGSPCESTPTTYLMAPRSSGSSTFSACSLERMAPVIASAAELFPGCLVPLTDFDVGVVMPAQLITEPGTRVALLLTVRNVGTEAATAVSLSFTAPQGLVIADVSNEAGFCDHDAGQLSCDLPSLAAGADWPVTVQLDTGEAGSFPLSAAVTAETDREPGNDTAAMTLLVRTPGSGSGGGGGSGLAAVAALGLAAARRCLTRR